MAKKFSKDTQIEKQIKFLNWMQEFSKKIIVLVSVLYLIAVGYILYMVYRSYDLGMISGLDTFISEMNSTFREIVGGYLIKSAIENAIKIGGSCLSSVMNIRMDQQSTIENPLPVSDQYTAPDEDCTGGEV